MDNKILIGKWFHGYKNGRLTWQGEIVALLDDGYLLLQTYEWCLGCLDCLKIVHIVDLKEFRLYNTNEQMKEDTDMACRREESLTREEEKQKSNKK